MNKYLPFLSFELFIVNTWLVPGSKSMFFQMSVLRTCKGSYHQDVQEQIENLVCSDGVMESQ